MTSRSDMQIVQCIAAGDPSTLLRSWGLRIRWPHASPGEDALKPVGRSPSYQPCQICDAYRRCVPSRRRSPRRSRKRGSAGPGHRGSDARGLEAARATATTPSLICGESPATASSRERGDKIPVQASWSIATIEQHGDARIAMGNLDNDPCLARQRP